MTESPLCREDDCHMPLDPSVRSHVLHLIAQKAGTVQNGKFAGVHIVTHLAYNNSEGIVGYSYLHGSKDYVGDFDLSAGVFGAPDGIHIHAVCTFNDEIKDNNLYASDRAKAGFARMFFNPHNYRISITWEMDYLVTYEEYASAMEDYDK